MLAAMGEPRRHFPFTRPPFFINPFPSTPIATVSLGAGPGTVGCGAVIAVSPSGNELPPRQRVDLVFDTAGGETLPYGALRHLVEASRAQLDELDRLVDPAEVWPEIDPVSRLAEARAEHGAEQAWQGCRAHPMRSQQQKAEQFRALHAGAPFVIPNPWDAGSAR